MGIDHGHQNKVCRKTNLDCFRSLYGSNPVVYAQIWEDLQTTEIEDARLTNSESNKGLDNFLMAINFLKCYPTHNKQKCDFKISDRTAREKTWTYLKKVQALKAEKVSRLHSIHQQYDHITHFYVVFARLSSFSDCLA
jgi:hypothetical protein